MRRLWNRLHELIAPLCLLLSLACSHTAPEISDPIATRTIQESLNLSKHQVLPKKLQTPGQLVALHKINRPYAEIRLGPGLEFPLSGKHLKKDKIVIPVTQYKYWVKILDIDSGVSGWIHRKSFAKTKTKINMVTLPSSDLHTIFVTDQQAELLDYKKKTALKLNVPRGTPFKVLNQIGSKYLVYLPGTNSVAWIHERSIR